jgi:hypothetical protein
MENTDLETGKDKALIDALRRYNAVNHADIGRTLGFF